MLLPLVSSVGVVLSFYSNEQSYDAIESFQGSVNTIIDTAVDYVDGFVNVSDIHVHVHTCTYMYNLCTVTLYMLYTCCTRCLLKTTFYHTPAESQCLFAQDGDTLFCQFIQVTDISLEETDSEPMYTALCICFMLCIC